MSLAQCLRCITALTVAMTSLGSPTNVVMRDVTVTTKYGRLRGNRINKDFGLGRAVVSTVFDRFLGIPYAKPPTGQRRFRAPEPPEAWGNDVIRDATNYGPACPQMIYQTDPDARLTRQDEDCLYLDIYSPFQESVPSARYPVMVYVHGGSYEVGSGRTIDGSVLCQVGVVVVSINYRLGALGFMSSGDELMPGNFGLLDQVETLRWVRDNIEAFRGDSNRVTVFGHSVGAASVGLMMILPQAAGLYHGVIAHSGVATAPYSIYDRTCGIDFNNYVRSVGKMFSCQARKLDAVIDCLRLVPPSQFIDKRANFPLYNPINPEFRPHVDGHVITDVPKKLFARGDFQRVPFIIGTVRDEFGNYFSGGERYRAEFDVALDSYVKELLNNDKTLFELVKFQYKDWSNKSVVYEYQRGDVLSDMHMIAPATEMADLVANHSADIYQYHFSTPGNSYHSVDLNYVFGAPFNGIFADEMTVNGTVDLFNAAERKLSLKIMRLWVNFATTGRPTRVDGPPPVSDGVLESFSWSKYTSDDRRYVLLSASGLVMSRQLRANYVAFWNELLPSLLTGLSPTTSLSGSTLALVTVVVLLVVCLVVLGAFTAHRTVASRRRWTGAGGGSPAAGQVVSGSGAKNCISAPKQ